MKRIVLFIFLLFVIEAQAFYVPEAAQTFEFNIKTIRMSRPKQEKLSQSVEVLREIFSSPEFRKRILRHRFGGVRTFYRNRGLSNAQIYQKILAGVERLRPLRNNAMDVEIELYTDFSSRVLGFTFPGTKRIWMNMKYFNKHSTGELAAHLTHEWLHKLGFEHEKERTPMRQYSVPYAIGYIVKDLAKAYE